MGKGLTVPQFIKDFLDVMASLKSFRKPLLVGHNIIGFDIPVLYNRLREFQLCQAFMAHVKGCTNTLKIVRRTFTKAEVGNHKQETLVKKLLKNVTMHMMHKKMSNYCSSSLPRN